MNAEQLVSQLKSSKEYFDRSSRELIEADATYVPSAGAFSTVNQIAHVAATVDWFVNGAFSPKGFDLDFEKMDREVKSVSTISAARAWVDRAFAAAIEKVAHSSPQDLEAATAAGPIMGGVPRWQALLAIVEHTAHHRGALSVYTRLRSKVPPMPYMDM